MTISHEIPASQTPAWITLGLTDSPQAFRLSDAPSASCEQVQKSMFNLSTLKILPTRVSGTRTYFLVEPYIFSCRGSVLAWF